MPAIPLKLQSKPGIGRDGTQLDGDEYVNGRWARFQYGKPRKIGGYRSVTVNLPEIVRGMAVGSVTGVQYMHLGSATKLTQIQMDPTGVGGLETDRTPAGLAASPNNLWTFEQIYDTVGANLAVVAHAAPNLLDIDSATNTEIWLGSLSGTGVLTGTGDTCSGGVVALHPYLMKYGSNGEIAWSVAGSPGDFGGVGSGLARVAGSKILYGRPMRGGNTPTGLFWSQEGLHRGAFVGGTTIWDFDTLSMSSSLLSSRGVAEYDSISYWPGVDRFLMFAGVQRELPNNTSMNWFYDNLNMTHRQKVFSFVNTRWGEIWWCFPFGNATECTHAIIYNVRENCWYDTELPEEGRSSAVFGGTYPRPYMTGIKARSSTYTLWQHESGRDKIDDGTAQAIESYFETQEITPMEFEEPSVSGVRIERIEPDFVQSGDMTVQVITRANARAPDVYGTEYTFSEAPVSAEEQTVPTREKGRLFRFKFKSAAPNGDYHLGATFAHISAGDMRNTK